MTRIFLKLWHCQIIWYLFESFKTIILCSPCSVWFVKYVLSAKIWFVKTSTRIVTYESWVVKLNSGVKSFTFSQSLPMVLIVFIHLIVCPQQLKVTKSYPFLPHSPLTGILLTNDTYKALRSNTINKKVVKVLLTVMNQFKIQIVIKNNIMI